MSKKLLIRMIKSKASKRALSALVAVVLFFGALPMLEISEKLDNIDFGVKASADGEFSEDPDTSCEYTPKDSGYVELTPAELKAYSEHAHKFHKAHQNDKILIKRTSSEDSLDILAKGFVPLGTAKYPFKGSVTIAELSGLVLNLESPLFDYVYDSAQILGQSTQSGVDSNPIDITRCYSQGFEAALKKKPLLANNVVHDSSLGENEVTTWKVNIAKPNVDGENYKLQQFGGLIGQMWNNYTYDDNGDDIIFTGAAKLNLVVTMNKDSVDTNDVTIQGDGNTGFACGTMQARTSLSLDLISDRTIVEVSTTNGSVGGFVGAMEAASSFTYTCTSSPFGDDSTTNIVTTGSNFAGGIVGNNVGASVSITANHTINQTIRGSKGQGGLYGYYKPNTDITLKTSDYVIDDCVLDGGGQSGGLIGMLESNKNVTINVDGNIKSKRLANGTKASTYGGLIGLYKVDSKAHSLTINGSQGKHVNTDGASSAMVYGGGIGKIDDTVTQNKTDGTSYVKFDGFTLNEAANAGSLTFGGLVGIGDKAYIDAKDVTIKVNGVYKGGGLVGSLGYGVLRMDGTIDLSGAKANASITDNAETPNEKFQVGIIVGYRDDALIYAKPGWKLKRCMLGTEVDDIGAWGQVIRFDTSASGNTAAQDLEANQALEAALFTVDDTEHTIQINAPTTDYTTVGSVSDFAKTALCFQLDASNNEYLSFENTTFTWEDESEKISQKDISITASINLSGTGFAGFTRDNHIGGDEKHIYSGTISSSAEDEEDRPTITLAIGEAYGYNDDAKITSHTKEGLGKQYRHIYSGLFGSVSGFTLEKVNLGGSVYVNSKRDTMLAGAAAAEASGDFTVRNMNLTTSFVHAGGSKLSLGGLLGEATNNIGDITVSSVGVTANISGTASNAGDLYLGGVIGRINETGNKNVTWQFNNVTVSGSISNTWGVANNCMGGLVAVISHNSGFAKSARSLKLTNVTISGLALSASKSGGSVTRTIGGLLGYGWYNVNVDFNTVVASALESDNNTITLSDVDLNYGDIGGLVYCGTGYWTVSDSNYLQLNSLTVSSSAKKSLGLFVNKAWYASTANYTGETSSALYLELQHKKAYKITSAGVTGISGYGVFDEIAAYSAYYNDDGKGTRTYYSGEEENLYVLQNGAAVISIKTGAPHGLYMDDGGADGHASESYTAQSTQGNVANPYTRYYYNIDDVRDDNDSNAAKLMRWGLNQYAHTSIKEYFSNDFSDNTITAPATGIYDLEGYSWYPVDVDGSVTVNGTFKLYNREFEGSEDKAVTSTSGHSFDRTSLDSPGKTQHYLLHNGLFRNVNTNKELTVGQVTLQGNVGRTTYGSGALICGKVQGEQDKKAKVTTRGTVMLDRIYVHDYNMDAKDAYAPLLINKVGNHAQLTISAKTGMIEAVDEYGDYIYDEDDNQIIYMYSEMNDTDYSGLHMSGAYPKAGTSLIGNVAYGNSAATGVSIEFKSMILDGRESDVTDSTQNGYLDSTYGSQRSIFTKATFLNMLKCDQGSFGKYNFTYQVDWNNKYIGSTTPKHEVTYGEELGYTENDNSNTEYPGKERKYYNDSKGRFVNPVNKNDTTGLYAANFISGFIPYVATGYSASTDTHQIMVNQSTTGFDGCGTYNDPYTLATSEDFEKLSYVLNGQDPDFEINIPLKDNNEADLSATWHDKDKKHATFKYLSAATIIEEDGNGGTTTITCDAGFYLNGTAVKNQNHTGANFITKEKVVEYLAGAYYILTGTETTMTIENKTSGNKVFKGIGYSVNNISETTKNTVFRGVIDGNGKIVENKSQYPLIASAYGCVVKNLTLQVKHPKDINVSGSSNTFDKAAAGAYGGLIGKVLGGDNIIDNVLVDYSGYDSAKKIYAKGTNAQLAPIGGYVGVVENGGVIFRNMKDRAELYVGNRRINSHIAVTGLADDNKSPKSDVDFTESMAWLYINPYVGRVINGFVVNESDAYRPFEDGEREYGDKTKVYYNETRDSKGKIETSGFSNSEENKTGVTLKNGTKHYSITDICADESELKLNSTTSVEVPNAQAFFIMSLIVNSGMGKSTLGYNQKYMISRWAKYTDIDINTTIATANQPDDYLIAKNDSKSRAGYLANAYTTSSDYAKDMADQSSSVTLTATRNTTYYLPDGYKGLGNVYQKLSDGNSVGDKCKMNISSLNGGENTISQNTLFYHYSSGFDKGYNPNANADGEYTIGMGLITYQISDAKAKNLILSGNVKADTIDNTWATVDTNVGYAHIKYNSFNARMISVGSLFGCVGVDQTLTSVGLQNIDVRGVRYVGGMIGTTNTSKATITNPAKVASNKIKVHSGLIAGGVIGKMYQNIIDFDFNNCTFNITEVVSECVGLPNANYYDYGVGGIVGMCRSKIGSANTGKVTIKNVVIGSTEDTKCAVVKCENANIYTGGLVGIFNRAYLELSNCKIYNMNVEAQFAAGGLVGHWATAGGSSNTAEERQSVITNTLISGTIPNMMPEIKSTGKNTSANDKKYCSAGGFIGSGKDDMNNVVIQNSSIDNYKITAIVYAGGAAGSWGDSSTTDANNWKSSAVQFNNFRISDCTISATDASSGSAGGLLGNLNDGSNKNANNYKFRLYGYNVLSKNLTITGTNKGYICGRNGRTNTNDIKLAGYSRQDSDNSRMISNLVGTALKDGTNDSTVPYGTNGYVIFADYNDNASGTSTQYPWFSNVNNTDLSATNNVETMRSIKTWTQNGTTYTAYDNNKDQDAAYTAAGYDETTGEVIYNYKNENYPFVTSSPKRNIDTVNYLTGEGISKLGLSYSFDSSTFKKIITDKKATGENAVKKAYSSAPTLSNDAIDYINNHYSTSDKEFLTPSNDITPFPLIVVEDSNNQNVTDLINNYLGTLTNTSYNFADKKTNKTVFNVELRKMVYNSREKKFEDKTGEGDTDDDDEKLANLRVNGDSGDESYFYMKSKYVDTNAVQMFTLVDVQFYDPSSVTTDKNGDIETAEIAYHLYVPVYTRKILRYSFYATLASNTNYYNTAYSLDSNNRFVPNSLFENLSNPITYAFEYHYQREPSEWRDALNNGENVIADGNFRKTIIFDKQHTGDAFWPSGAKMILVDSTKEGENYYLDTLPSAPASGTKLNLDLVNFKSKDSNEAWKPSTFNDLLENITIVEDSAAGTLIDITPSGENPTAPSDATFYVKSSTGTRYFRPITTGDGNVEHKYRVDSVTVKPERYYLTILTPNEANKIYYYNLSSPSKFEHIDNGTGNIDIDGENWRPNNCMKNSFCLLLIGDIYEDNFSTAEDDPETQNKNESSLIVKSLRNSKQISENNNTITITMTSTVKLKDSDQKATIANLINQQKDKTELYHAFLMMYGKKLEANGDEMVGIVKNSQVVNSSFKYKAGIYTAADFDTADDVTSYEIDKSSSSFIKLTNGENLLDYLGDSTKQYAVTFQAEFTLAYYDEISRSTQFPPNDPSQPDPDIGSNVIGYSNIASSSTSVAYSASSEKKVDANRYYTANSTTASLSYNMVEQTSVDTTGMTAQQIAQANQDLENAKADGVYRSLGINAKTDSEGYILSSAEYDTHKLTSKGDYIEFTLTLSRKGSYVTPSEGNPKGTTQGQTALTISDYLYDVKIQGAGDIDIFDTASGFSPPSGVTVSTGDGDVYTIRVHKSKLKTRGTDENLIYILPIRYKVKTGDGTNKWNDTYSNYKVTLTAEMFNLSDEENAQPAYLKSSWAYDHLIYTNAKVETNVI